MTTALEGIEGSASQKRPGTQCTGGWVGPRAGLDMYGKSRPPPGFDSRTVQPVASHYTDWVWAINRNEYREYFLGVKAAGT